MGKKRIILQIESAQKQYFEALEKVKRRESVLFNAAITVTVLIGCIPTREEWFASRDLCNQKQRFAYFDYITAEDKLTAANNKALIAKTKLQVLTAKARDKYKDETDDNEDEDLTPSEEEIKEEIKK